MAHTVHAAVHVAQVVVSVKLFLCANTGLILVFCACQQILSPRSVMDMYFFLSAHVCALAYVLMCSYTRAQEIPFNYQVQL